MQKKLFRLLLALLIGLPGFMFSAQEVQAQGISASELIAAVNALRATYDLEPYQVDSSWMAVAQAHSEYQASIGELTHTRADGSEPGDHQISSENIGGGYAVSAQTLFNQWANYWHIFTLVGFSSGLVGAGVAAGSDGYLYYTLVVKNTGELTGLPATDPTSIVPASEGTPVGTVQTSTPLVTVTPQADGSIVHTVAAGQTLWDIAIMYETEIAILAALNNLDPENPLIYPGQSILVRQGYTATPTGTITNTPLPPTRTLRPSRTPQPSRLSLSPSPIETVTGVPLLPENSVITQENMNTLAIVTIVIALSGLIALVFGRFWNRKNA